MQHLPPLWGIAKSASIPIVGKSQVYTNPTYKPQATHTGKNKDFQGERSIPKIWYKPILSDYINII